MGVVRRGSDVTSHVSSVSGKSAPCLQHFSVIRSIGRGAFGKVSWFFLSRKVSVALS